MRRGDDVPGQNVQTASLREGADVEMALQADFVHCTDDDR